jgi:hypothetical protein
MLADNRPYWPKLCLARTERNMIQPERAVAAFVTVGRALGVV